MKIEILTPTGENWNPAMLAFLEGLVVEAKAKPDRVRAIRSRDILSAILAKSSLQHPAYLYWVAQLTQRKGLLPLADELLFQALCVDTVELQEGSECRDL